MLNPDQLYLRSREDLLPYEDARFNSLIQAVANYYTTRNDQSRWGAFLRAIAQELGHVEYATAYSLVNKEPRFLTPPDIKRRWAGPLFVSRSYPNKSQFDLEFKLMIQRLLLAHQKGARVEAIRDVIFAYTGENVIVEELFKEIGLFFDVSDRNAIRVAVKVVGATTAQDVNELNRLQVVTEDLYGAIDLIKPAHVGLNFTTVFGLDENLDELITEITDELRIYLRIVEEEPLDPMLIQAPIEDPNNPKTTIAPADHTTAGLIAPRINRVWEITSDELNIPDLD